MFGGTPLKIIPRTPVLEQEAAESNFDLIVGGSFSGSASKPIPNLICVNLNSNSELNSSFNYQSIDQPLSLSNINYNYYGYDIWPSNIIVGSTIGAAIVNGETGSILANFPGIQGPVYATLCPKFRTPYFNIPLPLEIPIWNVVPGSSRNNVYVGGIFTINGVASNVAKYTLIAAPSTNVVLDTSFNLTTNNTVRCLTVLSDGYLIVGGRFTSAANGASSVNCSGICKTDPNGIIDQSFASNIGSGFDSPVISVVAQPDNKILCGGQFNVFNGNAAGKIIRLNSDGSRDSSFNCSINDTVMKIALQPDGKILCAGFFTSTNGVTTNRIVRLNSDGSIDNTFNSGTGFNSFTNTILLDFLTDKILVAGTFSSYNNVTIHNHYIRLNSDGSIDSTFNPRYRLNPDHTNFIHKVNNNEGITGNIFLHRNSDAYSPSSYSRISNSIATLNQNLVHTTDDFGSGFSKNFSSVTKIVKLDNNQLLCIGNFTSYRGTSVNRIVKINTDGTIDNTFNLNIGSGPNAQINDVVVVDDRIYLGGAFTSFNGVSANRVIALENDGTIVSGWTNNTILDSAVLTIALTGTNTIWCGTAGVNNLVTMTRFGQPKNVVIAPSGHHPSYFQPPNSWGGTPNVGASCTLRLTRHALHTNPADANSQNGIVRKILPLPDGSIAIGGFFSTVRYMQESVVVNYFQSLNFVRLRYFDATNEIELLQSITLAGGSSVPGFFNVSGSNVNDGIRDMIATSQNIVCSATINTNARLLFIPRNDLQTVDNLFISPLFNLGPALAKDSNDRIWTQSFANVARLSPGGSTIQKSINFLQLNQDSSDFINSIVFVPKE